MNLLPASINRIIPFLLLVLPIRMYAGTEEIRFTHLTINEGLSLSSVYCIYQDSKGFMWFGTEDGLNKYDGSEFTIYRTLTGEDNCPAYKWTEIIYEDSKGILWFGSRGGLTRFDPAEEKFTQYRTERSPPYRLTNDTILQIRQISENHLLVGTVKGLNRIDLHTLACESYTIPGLGNELRTGNIQELDDSTLLISESHQLFRITEKPASEARLILHAPAAISCLAINEKKVWIGTRQGLYAWDILPSQSDSELPQAVNPDLFGTISILQMLPDPNGNLWIATNQGLFRLSSSGKTERIIPENSLTHSLALVRGTRLLRDARGYIWYATHGNGLYCIEPDTGLSTQFLNNPFDPGSLAENSINCIYLDRNGVLWSGTFGAGISIYDPNSLKFTLLRKDPGKANSLASNFIWSIFEDRKGKIWIGTNDQGISVYSPKEDTWIQYNHEPGNSGSLSNSSVREIFEDRKGTIWVGTDGGGLDRWNGQENSFRHFRHDPDDPYSISDNSVRVIYQDSSGDLWIGTRNGLNRFDPDHQNFIRYLNDPRETHSLSNNFIYSLIYEDSRGNLWIGTYGGGLNRLDPQRKQFERFSHIPDDSCSISDNIVFSLVEDTSGILWVGTNSGLDRFDPQTGKFSRFGMAEGLPNEVIYGLLEDYSGKLWMSTNLGICRFDPADSSTINYNVTHGLQSNEFNGGAFHKGYSGNLYFGGVYGLNIIDPHRISDYRDHSNIVFTRLEIMGNEVQVRPDLYGTSKNNHVLHDSVNYFLRKSIAYANEIILAYPMRYFSLEFADLGNMLYQNTNYSYKMEGLDDSWQFSGSRNYVSYANMKPGAYYFSVRSQQPNGSWSKTEGGIRIVITPPFWMRWWFILLEILTGLAVALGIFYYLIQLRTYRILEIQNRRIQLANDKLTASEKDLKLMNATKDKFFSIISHDLKNPFTSLLSISESISDNYGSFDEAEKKFGLQKMHQNILYIYRLLENLLTWSRAQSGKIAFNPVLFNLTQLLQENYNLYQLNASGKDISLRIRFEKEVQVFGDREMINTVIRNLLNNALKFTPKGKSIEFGIQEKDTLIEVFVRDEGIGIPKENLSKLFRIDQKVKTEGTEGEKGTGLGLIICREFIERHKGEMIVTSRPGEGSTFSFTLPKS